MGWKRLILPIVMVLGLAVGAAGVAAAVSKNIDVSGTTDSTIYKVGQTVHITGVVNGDVNCAGQTVTVDAMVNGDVICAGQSVTVVGTVRGNVRLAGQTVDLGARVGRNASLAGQTVTISRGATVGVDAGLWGQNVNVNGSVGRDINGTANTIAINSTVGRNIDATVNHLKLLGGARVAGNVNYTSTNTAERSGGAVVSGRVAQHQPSTQNKQANKSSFGKWLVSNLIWLAILLVFSLVLVALLPQLFRRWGEIARTRNWRAFLVGLVATILFPILITALFVSIIGIPIALFLLLVLFVLAILAYPAAAYVVGRLILRRRTNVFLVMLLGIVLLWLVGLIPVLGNLVQLVAFWLGFGTVLISIWRFYPRPVYRTEPVETGTRPTEGNRP